MLARGRQALDWWGSFRTPWNRLSGCPAGVAELSKMPTASLELGLCLLIPLLKSFLFIMWFSATLDSRITFTLSLYLLLDSQPIIIPYVPRHTSGPPSPTSHFLSSLFCLTYASAKSPLWVFLYCLAPLFLWKGLASHSLPQLLWLCLGALNAIRCFLFPSPQGLFLLLVLLWYLGGLFTGLMLAFWKCPWPISWLCLHWHCLTFRLPAEQGPP